ncbi:MAG: AraC family transcriptional regulator [Rhizobacter sp.]|nr:AraC family transcriptional regulator [Rhizobacter sp.]
MLEPKLVRSHALEVSGALRPFVKALIGVELGAAGPLPLSVAPHESLMLTVQLGREADCIEQKGAHGENTSLTGIRQHTGQFLGAGDCVTLFALLTPLGAVHLLDSQPLSETPRIRARVAELLDRQVTRGLESEVALAATLQDKLWVLAAWLENRATTQRRLARGALRAGRAAMRLCAEPGTGIEALADEQHVSRRQLERDFGHWIGTSPRHLSQVARVQAVSRKASTGASLADISADVGFADQAHMSRVVRQVTGLTPKQLARSKRTEMADAFSRATGGATVYL